MTTTKQSWLKRSLAVLLAVMMVMSMGVAEPKRRYNNPADRRQHKCTSFCAPRAGFCRNDRRSLCQQKA